MRSVAARLSHWIDASLRRRLIVVLTLMLGIASIVFLPVLVGLYREHLITERGAAAGQVYRLLEATLENAMLKRDIDGLRQIVDRLGQQSDVARVMILAPSGEVRFASDPSDLGRRFGPADGELCPGCTLRAGDTEVATAFLADAQGEDILRSVVPVANREPCQICHSAIAEHPVNGILVVDYRAAGVRKAAMRGAALMSAAGVVVVGVAMVGVWLALEVWLLRPISLLRSASAKLAAGDLVFRVAPTGQDELADLGRAFDGMAARIAGQVADLEGREHFLQAMIDAIPDGIRVIGTDFRVERVNRAFLEQQGLTASEVVGLPCYVSSHRRDSPCAPTMVTCPVAVLADGQVSKITCRHRHVRADGEERFVEISAAALDLRNGAGQRRLVIESIRDLSQEIQLSHEHRLSEIGMLAAGVAHEIYNPLSSIRLGLRSLRHVEHDEVEGQPDYLRLMEEEIEKCIEITHRLLKLSVPASESAGLIDLTHLVPEVISLVRSEAERDGIDIAMALEPALRVLGSDSDMRILTLNLVQNAFHAMAGGGTLTLSGGIEGGEIVMRFADTGVGIAEQDIERIFQPFWSRRADKGGRAGTGLGLSICRAVVQKQRGHIEVASRIRVGTTVTVRLPWADAA